LVDRLRGKIAKAERRAANIRLRLILPAAPHDFPSPPPPPSHGSHPHRERKGEGISIAVESGETSRRGDVPQRGMRLREKGRLEDDADVVRRRFAERERERERERGGGLATRDRC
jgi:hypothetical protein